MTRDELIRAAMHFPVGVLAVLIMAFVNPPNLGIAIGLLGALAFLVYEIMQDWRKHDKSYKDVIGFVAGIYSGAILIWLLEML